MNYVIPAYRIFPLGDNAITIDFGNVIDQTTNSLVIKLFNQFRQNPFAGLIETIPAYSSITVYYDVFAISKTFANSQSAYEYVSAELIKMLQEPITDDNLESRLIKIPVCYEREYAPDLDEIAKTKGISADDVVRIHMAKQYRVYMIGFLPGLSYMGEVDEEIAVPRKSQPKPVAAGSIGIAGKQTGIYPAASPGGWQIIGRTPLKLFDATKEEPTLLKAGDTVQFFSISKHEFENN